MGVIIKMKKLICFAILCLLLVGTISAWEWDNGKSYDSEQKEVTIKNGCILGVCIGGDIAKIKLDSDNNVEVLEGDKNNKRKIAEITFDNSDDYEKVFTNLELYDLKKESMQIEREFVYKYRVLDGYHTVTKSKGDCDLDNMKACEIEEFQMPDYSWHEIDEKAGLPKGKITIGIFAEVRRGDYVEWIPTFYGVRINEWATWSSAYETNLVAIYNMEESSGAVIDAWDGTDNSTGQDISDYQAEGVYNYGNNFTIANTDFFTVASTAEWTGQAKTLSAWVKFDGTNGGTWQWTEMVQDQDQPGSWGMGGGTGSYIMGCAIHRDAGGGQTALLAGDIAPYVGTWQHFVCVWNSTGSYLYMNGTLKAISECASACSHDLNADVEFGRDDYGGGGGQQFFGGTMDEIYFWDEDKDASFVSDLYDSGAGTFYRTPSPPTTALIFPANDSQYTTLPTTIEFNCNATDDAEVINMSLLIDGETNYTETGTGSDFLEIRENVTFTSDSSHNWTCIAYDNYGDEGSTDTYVFGIDSGAPVLTDSNITNLVSTSGLPINSTWWFNATDINLDSCWYATSENLTNTTITCNADIIQTEWTTEGTKVLYFCANDSYGFENCDSQSLSVFEATINQFESKDPVSEGASVTYTLWINMTDIDSDWTETNATMTLNNTVYSSTKTVYSDAMRFVYIHTFSNESGNSTGALHNWNWFYNIQNSSDLLVNQSTISSNTTVFEVGVDDCTSYGTLILNYTLYDEEYKSNTLPIALANQSIEADVTITKGIYNWEYAVDKNGTNNILICVPNEMLNNTEYLLDVVARYKAQSHVVEFNYIDNYNLSNYNNPQIKSLYDLYSATDRSEYSTSFLVNYQDENYLPVQDAIIDLWRYYVGDGEFLSVENGKTDQDGNTRLHFVTEDVRYKALVRVNGELVYTSPEFLALCQATPCQINLQKESGVTSVGNYSQIDNLAYSVELDQSSKTVILTYTTLDGSSSAMQLNVTQFNAYGNNTVCQDSATASGGTLTCTVPDTATNTTYYVEMWKDGTSLPVYMFDLNPNAYETFGYTGVILTGLLFITLVLMAVSSGGIAVLIFGFMGLISATMLTLFSGGSVIGVGSSLMWLLVAIIIVAIKIANRRGG